MKKLSEKFYGTGYNWGDIAEASKLANPDRVEAGMEITIPNVAPIAAPEEVEYEEYTVRAGETLFDIAVKVYGDGFAYIQISRANNLRNANRIEVGQKLVIPR